MSLDLSTLYLVATLVAAMLGALLLFFWRQERIAALGWWGTAYLIGAVSIGVWVIGADRLGETGQVAVSALGFIACGMVWSAARVFHGRQANWIGAVAGALLWVVAMPWLRDGGEFLRATAGASIVAAYAALTAGELWLERRAAMQRRWPAMVIPVLHGGVLMLPVLLGGLMPSEHDAFRANSTWMMIFAIELVLYAVGTVFIVFMMVSERNVRAHKAAASMDPLTGVLNRRGFSEETSRMIAREAKAGRPVTVMIFDIDHFKSVNDRFGHQAGDEILKLFATVVASNLRTSDLVGRIGGEEFAAMVPCSLDEAMLVADRVRQAFQDSGVEVDSAPVDTTVSIGVAGGRAGPELDVLLASADAALYRAKRSGRNRVEAANDEPPSPDQARRRLAAQSPPPRPAVVCRINPMKAAMA